MAASPSFGRSKSRSTSFCMDMTKYGKIRRTVRIRPGSGHTSIRFSVGAFRELRNRLLADLSHETFAVLLGRHESIGNLSIINVVEARFLVAGDYEHQSLASLEIKKSFVHSVLVEVMERLDVDTLVDVHTHPFSRGHVYFSGTDDADERNFSRFLHDRFGDAVSYASIVLSQSDYSARVWRSGSRPKCQPAVIRTVTYGEAWPASGLTNELYPDSSHSVVRQMFDRAKAVVGLDVLRTIAAGERIAIIGMGGLGSIIAENLIHMGFSHLDIIDDDIIEVSNLNRVVGAYAVDAEQARLKVDVARGHLLKINPSADVVSYPVNFPHPDLEVVMATATWIIVSTDNHVSRFWAQKLGLRFFVPVISVGSNITVDGERVVDMSGEVFFVRPGDGICLSCSGRLSAVKMAAESHPDRAVRDGLVAGGYVSGEVVAEPAVKTLNAMLGALCVDLLVNQYTERQPFAPVTVYENNSFPAIYRDERLHSGGSGRCFTCGVVSQEPLPT